MNGCLFFLGPVGWIIMAIRNNRKATLQAISAGNPYAVQRNALVLEPRFDTLEKADAYRVTLVSQGVPEHQLRVVTVR